MSGPFSQPGEGESLFPADSPGSGGRFVRVVVERGIDDRAGSDGYTYRCNDERVSVGDRVRVPLGRGNSPAQGVVVSVGGDELLAGLAASKVKATLGPAGGRVEPQLVQLAKWISAYYVCPLGMALGAMIPGAVKGGKRRRIEILVTGLSPKADAPDLKPATRALVERIRTLDAGTFPAQARALAAALELKSPASITRLIKAELLRTETRAAAAPLPFGAAGQSPGPPPRLVPEQAAAVDGISATLGSFAVHLLLGVTGSGKTEVYLRSLERAIEGGRSAIVLVPEISLTPQTSGRFGARFARHGVAVLHSGLTPAQRHAEWERAASGDARVIVGARSAVFAPVRDLGIIVVDEEHDGSYKQDQLPRYHARDVAIKRGQLAGCPVVLGSATPALETYSNAVGPEARFKLWELPRRVGGGELPKVEIVDLAEERRSRARLDPSSWSRQHAIGPRLEAALGRTLDEGGQAILLLNRRGFANHLCCPDSKCGFVLTCDQCDAAMVFHKDRRIARGGDVACHHCLSRMLLPNACPTCGKQLNLFGVGTQRLEEELQRLFQSRGLDERSLQRADSDTMQTARDYFDALDRFARGDVRVLLGTQMIAKGLDFPNVRLVGVVSADTALNLPDFRASERTFQLVSQVAGRAGRGSQPGLVIVQTMEPANGAIILAAAHDYKRFAASELQYRARAGLPPSTRMARVVCRDADLAACEARAGEIASALRRLAGDEAVVRGPAPCPIARTHGEHRISVEITARAAGIVQRALTGARNESLLVSDARTAIDVDPVSLM